MYVSHLQLVDFRSYAAAQVKLEPGVSVFLGANGQGKTNLLEAIGYAATLGSHRVGSDAPLVAEGAERAVIRAAVVRDDRRSLVELEINPGRANRARLNRAPVNRVRDVVGTVRTVLFAPEDLELVKGDPTARRRFLDDLLTQRFPRFAGVRGDYDRVLKQRNALLRSAAQVAGRSRPDLSTLQVWDGHLATTGGELVAARQRLVAELAPRVADSYRGLVEAETATALTYRGSARRALDGGAAADQEGAGPVGDRAEGQGDPAAQAKELGEAVVAVREEELRRGTSLVGPHRDDLVLGLGGRAAKGYASQGESWSLALSLKLASFELLRAEGDDPVLILDDVFSELDAGRRRRLAARVGAAEQVLVSAAVAEDVPAELQGRRFSVHEGEVRDE